MDDPIDRAVRSLERLRSPMQWQDVERRASEPEWLDEPGARAAARPRRIGWVAAGFVVAVSAAAVLLANLDGSVESVDTGPDPVATEPTRETEPPVGGYRQHAAQVWTGDEYLVWGGLSDSGERLADGWRYDPASGEVTGIAPGPLVAMQYPVAAWNGTELFVCCGDPGASASASYDPATRAWRSLATPHGDVTGIGLGATRWNDEMLVLANPEVGEPTRSGRTLSLWALNPTAEIWRELPGPQPMSADVDVHWTDGELLVWGRGSNGDSGQRFDLITEEWTALPPLPSPAPWYSSSVWTGEELVVWGISSDEPDNVTVGYRWSPATDQWDPLPPAPIEPVRWGEWTPGSQSMGLDQSSGRVIAVSVSPGRGDQTPRPLLAYQPTTNSWTTLGEVAEPGPWGRRSLLIADGDVLVPDATDPVAFSLPG